MRHPITLIASAVIFATTVPCACAGKPDIVVILADHSVTLAEVLRSAGYQTLMNGNPLSGLGGALERGAVAAEKAVIRCVTLTASGILI